MIEFMKDLAVSGMLAVVFFGCVAIVGVIGKAFIAFWKRKY